MSLRISALEYQTKLYYPYIVALISLNKEKAFYLKKVYLYKNMFICSSSSFKFKQGLLYFNVNRNDQYEK